VEVHRNPIPASVRGKIIVTAIITGGFTGTVTMGLAEAGVSSGWVAVVASAFGAVGAVAASLARANLTPDEEDDNG
jgi:hypothetical protein